MHESLIFVNAYLQFVKKHNEKSFGNRLLEAFQGASQTEIARQLGLSNPAITNYVEGRIPPAETLIKIASLTGYSIHWLVTGEEPKKTSELNLGTDSRAQTIMLANKKGGAGKSTSTAMLGVELAKRGYRTLVIDAELGDCTYMLFAPPLSMIMGLPFPFVTSSRARALKKRMFFRTEISGLDVCCTSKRAMAIIIDLGIKGFNTDPKAIRRSYDFILLDTNPYINPFEPPDLFTASLMSSAQLLMPIHAHPMSLGAVGNTLKDLNDALSSSNDINFLGAFLTAFYPDRSTSLMMIDKLNELLPGKLLKTIIHERDEIAELSGYSPLQLIRPDSLVVAEYSPLANEVLSLLGRNLENR